MKRIPRAIIPVIKEWNEHKIWVIIAGVIVIFFIYYARWKSTAPPVYIKVPEIREVTKWKIKKVEVPIKTGKVVVLDKKKVGKHVPGLPEDFMADPKKQVTSTADIKPSEAGTDVINIIDTDTGVSEIFASEHKLPFFALENKGEIGIRVGMSNFGQETDIYGQRNFVRIGSLHIGGYVEGSYMSGRPEEPIGWKVMGTLSKKW